MIKIGINENVVLSKAVKNEQGTLETTWREITAPASGNPLDAFNGGESEGTSTGDRTIKLFPFDNKPSGDKPVDATEITRRINVIRDLLVHILKGYMTQAKIDEVLNSTTIFAGTGINSDTTKENFAARVLMDDVLVRVYDNLVNGFITLITPHLDDEKQPMRLLLVRQSAAKAYADYRKNFIKDNPFLEPMSVPKEQSALKFTKWEIEKGKNSSADISAPADEVATAEAPNPFAVQ